MSRSLALASFGLLLLTSVGCKQLMRGADEVVDVGRRLDPPTRIPDLPTGGVTGKVTKAAVQVAAEEAIAWAAKEGVTPGQALPDMTGSWMQSNDFGDGMSMRTTIERAATPTAGVYDVSYSAHMTVDGKPMMTFHIVAVEVLSPTHQCQWVNSLRLDFPSPEVELLLTEAGSIPTVNDLNQEICDPVDTLTADLIHGVTGDDDFAEHRVR